MPILETGGSTTGQANVNSNFELNVALASSAANAGFARMCDKDSGSVQFSDHGRQKVGAEALLFYDPVDGAVINTNLWQTPTVTSFALAISAGFILLNSGAITTASAQVRIEAIKTLPFLSHYPLYFHCKAKVSNVPQSNSTTELGFGAAP